LGDREAQQAVGMVMGTGFDHPALKTRILFVLTPEVTQFLETCLFTGNTVFGRGLFYNLCLCLQCVKITELLIHRSYKNNIVITKFTFVTHFALKHGTLLEAFSELKTYLLFVF
jgi:hypothetical protein